MVIKMAEHIRFIIRNDLSRPLILNIEPQGSFFPLAMLRVYDQWSRKAATSAAIRRPRIRSAACRPLLQGQCQTTTAVFLT